MITALLPAMGGVNLIYGMGMLDLGMTFSFEQLLIDNEIARQVLRAINGIDVTDETLAVDIISKVGPAGNFLGQKHTLKHLKAGIECEKADLFDRTMRAEWDAAGQPMINDVAQKRAQDIINDYKPTPLDKDVQDELNAIVAEGAK